LPNVFAGNDLVVCEGQTTVLTASGAQTYAWDNNVTNGVAFVPTVTTTYTVTGTSEYGCVNTDEVEVTVIPLPEASFTGEDLIGCSPVTPTFTNTSTGDLENCVWSFSNGQTITGCGDVSATFTTPGCYDVSLTVTTPEGCSNTTTAVNYVCVEPDPVAGFTANPSELSTIDPTSQFINTSTDAETYNWSFGDGSQASDELSPSHTFPDGPGIYEVTLTAYSPAGCVDSTTQVIIVKEELIFYVPNAFTPDNDDYNEEFKPIFTQGFDPFNYNLLIFNRWGEVLFESNDAEFGWNGTYGGKIVQDGVYIWKITFKRNGVDDREQHVGHVTLIR
jgi:gliding motility-associated-like protein